MNPVPKRKLGVRLTYLANGGVAWRRLKLIGRPNQRLQWIVGLRRFFRVVAIFRPCTFSGPGHRPLTTEPCRCVANDTRIFENYQLDI